MDNLIIVHLLHINDLLQVLFNDLNIHQIQILIIHTLSILSTKVFEQILNYVIVNNEKIHLLLI